MIELHSPAQTRPHPLSMETFFEVYLLMKLDPGGPVEMKLMEVDPVSEIFQEIFRRSVTDRTARTIRERLESGFRLPPALHWRWLHGSPVLEELVNRIAA